MSGKKRTGKTAPASGSTPVAGAAPPADTPPAKKTATDEPEGRSYLVGEQGPEILTGPGKGAVVRNSRLKKPVHRAGGYVDRGDGRGWVLEEN